MKASILVHRTNCTEWKQRPDNSYDLCVWEFVHKSLALSLSLSLRVFCSLSFLTRMIALFISTAVKWLSVYCVCVRTLFSPARVACKYVSEWVSVYALLVLIFVCFKPRCDTLPSIWPFLFQCSLLEVQHAFLRLSVTHGLHYAYVHNIQMNHWLIANCVSFSWLFGCNFPYTDGVT